ncbi:hypothetical protein M527_12800 [Sphingobium indicum IP26]|uniref:Uncharacterized protein n=1 Tax=Sphingobium indicum F2 TaxID=1450518 RepID=A0A8E0WS10_9SPHN|nr:MULTISPECIES: hypothetical protein [Sphingobium]EPR14161.1 hypothetical protein M527_29035 [Sphingobium indicum IP26]EPR18366.1 hypothetical protein M527_12800 [Sphingobium indicum IP26]EQB03646.1 hypothetical protein L286_11510 [Sphingobium sp. HDIP04]KER36327.1 hypothetical protein AL00_11305 [Sphingobium indicum F2]
MEFSNREIAGLVWLAVFILFAMRKRDVRSSFVGLVKAFFQPLIVVPLAFAAIYITGVVVLLERFQIWTVGNLKTTILWAFSFAFATMLDINRVSGDRTFFGKAVRDAVGITATLTFMVEFYSFSLPVELIAVPSLTLMGMMHVLSGHRPEHAAAGRVLGSLLSLTGLGYIGYSLYQTVANLAAFATLDTLREFGIPIVLTVCFLPFLYLLVLYAVYERVFMGLGWSIKDDRLRRLAKWRAFFTFGPKLRLLERWAQSVARFNPDDRTELLQSFVEIKTMAKREADPPPVPNEDGWSPYAAKTFLRAEGLPTRDYHRSFEDEWFAGSGYLEVGGGIIANNMAYYLNGNENAVTELKLKLNINSPAEPAEAETRFREICHVLLARALGESAAQVAAGKIVALEEFSANIAGKIVTLSKEEWQGGIKGGYSRGLVIGCAGS